ncbi:MAG: PHP domain-containing protein [Desulfobacterota bacterium]|nr:PHP domain-containing protein [Thermodesulfobacteriota bacterium]
MLRRYRADLHIHSCLSPCGSEEMRPQAVVDRALEVGLDMIAICDHNSAENLLAFIEVGQKHGMAVLPGMEVTSREEIHLLTLLNRPEDCLLLQDWIYHHLPGENDPELFGPQILVDETSEAIGLTEKMLIGATLLSFEEIARFVKGLDGVTIASHIDRQAFSVIGQLGFIPEGAPLDGLEVSSRIPLEEARHRFRIYRQYPFVTFSDAHRLDEIGRGSTLFLLGERTSAEIRMALHAEGGRKVLTHEEA